MNEISKVQSYPRRTTQGAEGLPRYKWSVEQFDKLAEHGFFSEKDRIELIGGELVPMSPKGNRHELVRDELQDFLIRRLPTGVKLSSEIGWRPDAHNYLEPDIMLYPKGFFGNSVLPTQALLVIEVSDSSLRYDLDPKAKIYAGLGVREYWVVDANTLQTRVHREPAGESYGKASDHQKDETLIPALLPALAVSLGALKLG